MKTTLQKLLGISPLLVFLIIYLGASVVAHDFYSMPLSVAFLLTSAYAVCLMRGEPLNRRLEIFSAGAGKPDILLMIWIFIIAAAFAATAKAIGAVDATVNLTLHLLSGRWILAGIFLAACFISLAIGTSVGTIVALSPIAAGLSAATGSNMGLVVAVVVGGAYFGDNLSFISDTTIAATRTQGCQLSDKFRVNAQIVIPAALLCLALYLVQGEGLAAPEHIAEVEWVKVVPYLVVIVAAVMGANVMLVLIVGTLLSALVGVVYDGSNLFSLIQAAGEGILGMGELIIVTLLAGGLLETVKHLGGLRTITETLTRYIRGKRGAEFSIAALTICTNACTANNTVAILTVAPIARDIARKYHIDPRKTASILDTASCCIQSFLPYGAQMLMAAGLTHLDPMAIIPYLYYPMVLIAVTILAITFRLPRKFY